MSQPSGESAERRADHKFMARLGRLYGSFATCNMDITSCGSKVLPAEKVHK